MSIRRGHNSTRVMSGTALLLAATLALAACGGSGDGDDSANGAEDPPESGGDAAVCDVPEGYPNGPIEMIVPWSAGGGTDAVARLVANGISDALGVQVNAVNRTGGAGVVGHQAMVDANNDGQTIGLATAEIAMMHWQGLTDISHEDLTAISQVNADQAAVTVRADSGIDSAQDLIDQIEANPGTVVASGTAQGGIGHLAMLGMLMAADLPLDSVTWMPSDGAAPALQELVGGGIDFIVTSSIGEVASMVDAGEVVALAVMAEEPDSNFPDVPLLQDETGLDYIGGTWRGIVGPAGIDDEIVAALDCTIAQVLETEEFEQFMADSGYSIIYQNSQDFAAFLSSEDESFGSIMESAGLTQ